MESVIEFGVNATMWLQATYPQIEAFMIWVSAFGRFEFYLVLVPTIYWLFDKRLGANLLAVLLVSNIVNAMLKHLFSGPRPYWLDPAIGIAQDAGFGIPSGHVQTATTLVLLLGVTYRRGWVWAAGFVYIFLMALSRVYLGAHFVHDAVAGFLVGALIMLAYVLWMRYGNARFKQRILGQRLMAVVTAAVVLAAIYVAGLFLLDDRLLSSDLPPLHAAAWLNAVEEMTSATALLLSGGIALILEPSRVRFQTDGPWWQRLLRALLGFAVLVGVWRGLALVFDLVAPPDVLWLALPLRFVRYALLGLWGAYYAPKAFVALRLARAAPEPEITYTVSDRTVPGGPR